MPPENDLPAAAPARYRFLKLSGWPLAIALTILYLVLLSVLFLFHPVTPESADLTYLEDWWARAITAAVFIGLAIRSGIRMQQSHRVPRSALLLIIPVGIMTVGAALSVIAPGTRWGSMVFVVVGTISVGIAEEIIYRGFVLNIFAQRYTAPVAVLLSSVVFSVMHLGALQPTDLIVPFFLGLGLGWIYIRSDRNLWLVIALHAVYDLTQAALKLTTEAAQILVVGGLVLTLVLSTVYAVIMSIRWRGARLDADEPTASGGSADPAAA